MTPRSIPQGFAGFQGVGDALLGFALAAEADEGFALEIEQILLADELRRAERAAGQDVWRACARRGRRIRRCIRRAACL